MKLRSGMLKEAPVATPASEYISTDYSPKNKQKNIFVKVENDESISIDKVTSFGDASTYYSDLISCGILLFLCKTILSLNLVCD